MSILRIGKERIANFPNQYDSGNLNVGASDWIIECGNITCRNKSVRLLHRQMLFFDDTWACSADCLRILVARALRREASGVDLSEVRGRYQHRIPLGLIMLSRGWITQAQLQHALEMQKNHGKKRIGEWLISECGVDDKYVTKALGIQWNCPVFNDYQFDTANVSSLIPKELIQSCNFLPLRMTAKKMLYLAFSGDMNSSISYSIERMMRVRVESGQLREKHYLELSKELLGSRVMNEQVHAMPNLSIMTEHIAAEIELHRAVNSRMVRMHDHYWLRMWIREKSKHNVIRRVSNQSEYIRDYIYRVSLSV